MSLLTFESDKVVA